MLGSGDGTRERGREGACIHFRYIQQAEAPTAPTSIARMNICRFCRQREFRAADTRYVHDNLVGLLDQSSAVGACGAC